jgi:two-component system, NtrC family, sensor histidine kinase KinB
VSKPGAQDTGVTAIEDRTGALLELLVKINRDVAGPIDLRTVLQRLVFAAMEHVGGERGSIIVLDDTGKPVEATIVYGTSLHEHTTRQLKETVDRGLAGWVIRNRKPALVPDTSLDARWLRRPDDAADKSGSKAAICVPLIARERLVGALTVVHSMPNAFGPEHLELVQLIADQASIAVLNARLYTESTRQARIMTALADGAASFSSSLDVKDVLQRVLNQTIQALQVETAAIGLLEGPEESIVFRAATGQNAGSIIERRVPPGQGLASQVVREGRGVIVANAHEDKRFGEADRFAGIDARAIALAPIQAQGKVLGVLEAINPVTRGFDPDALTVMMGMGGLAGTTIRNAQLFEQLQGAHHRYRELFEESIDPLFLTDWDGNVIEGNRQGARLTGHTPEELRRMGIGQLHDVDWDKVGAGFAILRETGRATYQSLLRRADGGNIPVEVHARQVEYAATHSILWTLHDVTERKELDSLRQDLASMIYHDLRSPLGNVVTSLSLLDGMLGKDKAVRSALEVAVQSADRMQRLVNSLLDISRLEAGRPLVTTAPADPAGLIEKAIHDVTPAATGRRQTIQTGIEKGLPTIQVDADMIRRVLINLLENAIKFSQESTEIEVGVGRARDSVEFWVQDHGPGIPASEQQHIFEKFGRFEGSAKRPPGLGIGLAFCRIAARAHGGTIRLESEPGKGSRFTVALPIKPGQG